MNPWDLSQYQFDRPLLLWAVVVVVLFFLLREHGTVGWARARLFATTLVRCFAFLALVLALAGPHRFEEHPDLSLVFVVDGSGSSSGGRLAVYRERIQSWWERKGDVPARIVVASDELTRVDSPDEMDAAFPAVREDTPTDLGPAVELALESFERTSSKAVLLLSDGVVTEGQVDRAAAVAGIRGVRIFPMPPDDGKLSVAARRLELGNALVKQGEEISATVVVGANGAATVDVSLLDEHDHVLGVREGIEVDTGETPVLLTFRLDAPGIYPLRAAVNVDGDLFELDNVAHGAIEVVGPPRVLVAGEGDTRRRFGQVLSGMRPPMAFETTGPAASTSLDDVDLLVWLDPALGEVTQEKATELRAFVRRGGRLLMVGGPQGLAVADEGQDELKELLPVRFPKTEKKEPAPLAVVYCIDRSDSMGRSAKFEIALTAVAESIAMLEPTSRVGVVTFSDLPHWAVPMTTAADIEAIRARLSELSVHGGTSIYPALQMGYEALIDEEAKLKHMLLLTDGRSVSTLKRDGEVVHNVARRKFTLSTVAIGRESDQVELSAVASIGQGRFYYTDDFGSIPQIFLEETMTVVRTNKIEQQFQVHAVDDSRFLEGVDTETIPDLEGYIRSLQKTTSELALATERGEPVLVSWRHGRGIVTLFTSDFGGEWSTAWADWDQRNILWRTVIRETLTPQPAPLVDLTGEIVDGELRVEYSILDALKNPRNNLVVEAVVTAPGGGQSVVALVPSGPGRYAAAVPAVETGGYLASAAPVARRQDTVDASGGSIPGGSVQRSVGTPPPRETLAGTLNLPLLQRLADETGGRLSPDFAQVLEDGVETRRIRVDSWPPLLWAALALFLADIAVRRLRIPRWLKRSS
jgi:Ca-activated chloride channel homolog